MSMNNIDFLPQRYRQQSVDRRIKFFWIVGYIIIGSIIFTISTSQLYFLNKAKRGLIAVEPNYAKAQLKALEFSQLQNRLHKANASADLFTYLRHPWPKSQLLATIVKILPETVVLTGLEIFRKNPEPAISDLRTRNHNKTQQKENQLAKLLRSERDFKKLSEEFRLTRIIVLVNGVTQDTASLHRYVARLNKMSLLERVEVNNIEILNDKSHPETSSFQLQLTVQPGYGRQGGPRDERTAQISQMKTRLQESSL